MKRIFLLVLLISVIAGISIYFQSREDRALIDAHKPRNIPASFDLGIGHVATSTSAYSYKK